MADPKEATPAPATPEASATSGPGRRDSAPEGGEVKVAKVRKKKIKHAVPKARVCIRAGENNTIVTFTDPSGNKLGGSSSGSCGFKGTRKSTPYAAKVTAEKAAELVQGYGIESVTVEVKGLGPGREQAIRGLQSAGLNLDAIIDTTPIPHGGCRRTGRRRV